MDGISTEPKEQEPVTPSNTEAEKQTDTWIIRFSHILGRLVPDAISTSIVLMIFLFVVALALGNTVTTTMDAYYRGLWMLLPFTMQMTLIVVLSSILSSTPLFRRIVIWLSRMPSTLTQVVMLSLLVRSFLNYLNWGLGIALGPLTTIYFCNEAERKGIKIDFPFFLASGYAAGSIWQYGLSASAPLLMATPGHFLESTTGVMPLRTTIWSPASIAMVIGFPIVVTAATLFFMPRRRQTISEFPEAYKLAESASSESRSDDGTGSALNFSEKVERNSFISLILSVALAGWLYYHFRVKGASLDLNSLNTIFFLFCILLHKNIHNFTKALQASVVSCWPVLVIYHLYAGVAGLLQYTSIGEHLANAVSAVSTTYTFPLVTILISTVVAVFIPSSGGQWAIQGYVTSTAAESVGVTAQRGMLALGIGDQMGNLISPFWYVVVAGIARIEFRRFLGYGLIFAPLWFLLGVLIFTFLPC